MLRGLVVLLLLANVAMWAWTQGWLDGVSGVRANGDREPERLARQVRPESVQILGPGAASAASAPAADGAGSAVSPAPQDRPASAPQTPVAAACLEAGPYSDAQLAAAQGVLRALVPAGAASTVDTRLPGTWLVYMGKFANREAQLKKEDELKRRKLTYEEIQAPPELAPGLSLGRFDNPQAAGRSLEALASAGVRTARVAQIAPALTSHRLRIETADRTLADKLTTLQAVELGAGFSDCASPALR